MPNYEYRCLSCGKVFEVLQKFSDAPVETHAECGGAVEKLISVPAIQFKGSGFYINDYAKGNGKSSDKGDGDKGKSDGAKADSAKGDKKDSGGESKSKTDSSSSTSSDSGTSPSTSSTPAAPSSSSDKK